MDILFLIPQDHEFSDLQYDIIHEMPPLGVLYLATILKEHGYSVEVADLSTIYDPKERDTFLNEIILKKPKIVGMSTTTPSYPMGKKLAATLKKELGNGVILIWGGYHVTFLPEEPLVEGIADVVVKGEGENAMFELVKFYLEKIGTLDSIEGISYRLNGKIVHNNPNVLRVKNLDSLPIPDREFINIQKYTTPGSIISSRGCVAKCQFCIASSIGAITMRSPDNIVDEILLLNKKYGFEHFTFVDNTFSTHKGRILEIFKNIRDHGLNPNYFIESRVTLVNEGYIKMLAENNVVLIQFGVETGNETVLKDIRKNITLEKVENAVDLCVKYGIDVITTYIIGHPSDTRETVMDTINFAKRMVRKGAKAVFSILTPYPGSEVFINREKLGVEIIEWDFTKWRNLNKPIIRTKNLSRRDLSNLLTRARSEVTAMI